jgi:hypothetical protein
VERYHNGVHRAIAYNGEQDVEYRYDPPTIWSVAFHHPDKGECFRIEHFNNIKARKEFIEKIQEEYNE